MKNEEMMSVVNHSDGGRDASERTFDINELNIGEDIDEADLDERDDDENFDADDIVGLKDASELLFKNTMLNVKPYTTVEEIDAFERLNAAKKAKNKALYKEVFDEISVHNLRLVAKVASKRAVYAKALTFEDLVMAGYMGLRTAIEKYDLSKGFKFSTYGMNWIKQSVDREMMNSDDLIRMPVHIREKMLVYNKADEKKKAEMLEKSGTFRDALKTMDPLSLDMDINNGDPHDDSVFGDFVASDVNTENDVFETVKNEEVRRVLQESIERYSENMGREKDKERLKDILFSRFGFDGHVYTLQELGDKYNLTRERIRQIEANYLKYMRKSRYVRELAAFAEDSDGSTITKDRGSITQALEERQRRAFEQRRRDAEYHEALEKAGYKYIEIQKNTGSKYDKEIDEIDNESDDLLDDLFDIEED